MTSQPTDEFLNLPDAFPQDDPNFRPGADPASIEYPQIPPITISCISCERIVGDSSSFICATRHVGGITMENMVSVRLGEVKVTEAEEEAFDRYCLYKPIHCVKCDYILGKMYISIAAGVPLSLLNKFTISRTNVLFYIHGTLIPALQPAESEEIMRQLHPEPDDIALTLERVMNLMIYLREEQDGIVRELKRVGAKCGVDDIDLAGGSNGSMPMDGEEEVGNSWRNRISNLEGEMEKLRRVVGYASKASEGITKLTTEAVMEVPDSDHFPKQKRPYQPKRKRLSDLMSSNKRPAKSSSLSPPRAPASVLPHQAAKINKTAAKPVIAPLPSKRKNREEVLEISNSDSDGNEDASVDEESEEDGVDNAEEEDEDEDEVEHQEAEQEEDQGEDDEEEEINKPAPARAQSRRGSHQTTGKGNLKVQAAQSSGRNGKENERGRGIAKPGRSATSLPLGSGGKAVPQLGPRAKTTHGRKG